MQNRRSFGTIGTEEVDEVVLTAGHLTAKLVTFGARLTQLWVPGRDGTLADIVLGYDTLPEYQAAGTYFGATCGQYGNRIRKGQFVLDGIAHQLDCNERGNHLHGGSFGFDQKIWAITTLTGTSVTFSAVSGAGEMGFPGRSNLTVTYELTPDGLTITMTADTDAPTIMNMIHHSYFNLAGQGSGDVLGQILQLDAPFYTPVDDALLATGEIRSVTGTAFDFTSPKPIGQDGVSYDHNWCLDGTGTCATAWDPVSGRKLVLTTTEPGVQLYTSSSLSTADRGKAGAMLCSSAGFTLETQTFPDTPNIAHFPHCRLNPGETYRHEMRFRFSRCDPSGNDL